LAQYVTGFVVSKEASAPRNSGRNRRSPRRVGVNKGPAEEELGPPKLHDGTALGESMHFNYCWMLYRYEQWTKTDSTRKLAGRSLFRETLWFD